MITDRQIHRWLTEELITVQQAERMLSDISQDKRHRTSEKLVVVMSTIGALLFGVGAILFVAANWQGLSHLIKTALLISTTFGVTTLGYALAYGRRSVPRTGEALLFLGALLFGASLFLIGQIYHIEANSHTLILLWLAGILPLVYAVKSMPVGSLASILWFIWLTLVVTHHHPLSYESDWRAFPILFLLAAGCLFEAGGLHDMNPTLRRVARAYRLVALQVGLTALFVLTFRFFSGALPHQWNPHNPLAFSYWMEQWVMGLGVTALLLGIMNLRRTSDDTAARLEGSLSIGLSMLGMLSVLLPTTIGHAYTILFNLAMVGCIAALIVIGYQREDLRLVNLGMAGLAWLVLARYFDFFWDLLPRSGFFMGGGCLLVLGGLALERKRRELKLQFANHRRPS